ncbi:MAG: SDR family NAD(P)-dependent oxidoreductase [Anaerolineae bacterium]
MQTSLQGKVAFVTGSARRVGRGILLGFAAQGANVVIHHSNSVADAEHTRIDVKALGVDALVVQGDYADPDAIANNFEQIRAHYGRIDVLVNSASVFPRGDLLDIAPEEWDAVMGVNLRAPFLCTQHAGA